MSATNFKTENLGLTLKNLCNNRHGRSSGWKTKANSYPAPKLLFLFIANAKH